MNRACLLGPALGLLLAGCLAFHPGPLPDVPPDETFVEVEGVRLRVRDEGQGPAVVLLHGFASSLETWSGLVPTLRATHRVIALDLMGFGLSSRPESDYSPQGQAHLVLALLDKLGVERAVLVAHSWGSSVALALALEAPQRVERLVLYGAWVYEEQLPVFFLVSRAPVLGEILFGLFYNERPDERMALAFYDPARYMTEELAEAVERNLGRPGTRAAALAAARGQRFAELQARYAEVAQPVLLLWGREDVVSPPAIGERLLRELPWAELRVFGRCGHFPMIEAAAESNRAVQAFVAGDGRL